MSGTALAQLEQVSQLGRVEVVPWRDPVLDHLGHDPRSEYVERYWLPVLGPSTIFLLRHLAARLERSPGGYPLELADTARALGLGERSGRNAPFARTLARAVDFEMARLHAATLLVRRRLPPLARRHLARLPEALREQHERASLAPLGPAEAEHLRLRGRQLALSLLQLGEEPAAVERQLGRWRFHPALARECALWAVEARKQS